MRIIVKRTLKCFGAMYKQIYKEYFKNTANTQPEGPGTCPDSSRKNSMELASNIQLTLFSSTERQARSPRRALVSVRWLSLRSTAVSHSAESPRGRRSLVAFLRVAFLRIGRGQDGIVLRFMDDYGVGHWHLRAHLALRVVRQHDLHLDAKNALAHEHMANRFVDVVLFWLTGGDQVAIFELHHLRALCAELPADDHLAAFSAVLHDEADDAIARTPHRETAEELVTEGLGLRHGATRAVLDALREELDAVLRVANYINFDVPKHDFRAYFHLSFIWRKTVLSGTIKVENQ